jgi:hypothetical protein
MKRPDIRLLAAAWLVAVLVAGCSQGDPPECVREDEGEFFFTVASVPNFPVGADTLANVLVTLQNTYLDTVIAQPGFAPPVILYRFHATGYQRIEVQLNDLLLDTSSAVADRGLPVRKGVPYTVTIERTVRLTPASMGIKISDPQGVLYLGIDDFRPAGETGSNVFKGGYGDLNGEGELRVVAVDTGCSDRSGDPKCYLEISNRRLDFFLGTTQAASLWQTQDRISGNWRYHVHKAARIVATTSCYDALLRQNEVSFFVERAGARSP